MLLFLVWVRTVLLNLDGFPGLFYHKAWHIIGSDVILAVKYFFATNFIKPSLNSIFLILIPQSEEANLL